MIFYIIATLSTAIIALLTILLWQKTRSLIFPFGGAALYFWSIHGVWGVILDKLGDGSEYVRYHYLEASLFTVELDASYVAALINYLFFCTLVLTVPLLFARARSAQCPRPDAAVVSVNHVIILAFSTLSLIASYLIIADQFAQAVILGQSGYQAINQETIEFFTIHQILGRAALFSALIGGSVLICGNKAIYLWSSFKKRYLFAYGLVLIATIGLMVLLGNKNELFTGFVLATLLLSVNHRNLKLPWIATAGFFLLLGIASVDYFRGFALLSGGSIEMDFDDFVRVVTGIFFSNEAFAAHFSMYGAMAFDIPPTWGKDVFALLVSPVPINIWPDRPAGTYEYYAEAIGAIAGRGYTIHHATSWYLDFGTAGILLGGLMLGTIWTALFNQFAKGSYLAAGLAMRIFCIIAPITFTAYFPVLLRAGVSTYKGVAIGAFLIPVVALYLSSVKWKIFPWQFPIDDRSKSVS